ncbi:MAG TPA: FAD-binding oxidoreductase, partial [Phenylobacterium sp.]|nr:FAD-binding oxidoreductase [Phenylobacterium sp.]
MTVDQSNSNTLKVGGGRAGLGRSDQAQGHTTRRQLLTTALAVPMVSGLAVGSAMAAPGMRVRPGMAGWPKPADWSTLGRALSGRLAPVNLPDLSPAEAAKRLTNPFYLGGQPGLTQSSGWIDGWRSAPSSYVVLARDAADVSVAVRFAQRHGLRLVIKGGGHSYVGGSNALDSLLIWTRAMDAVTLHEAFVPLGSRQPPQPAVSLGAGCLWLQAYSAVTTVGGRYVQGGGCTTVGVAGFIQGGGFGSFSKAYGLGAASLMEAEIVTADGVVRIVNADREPDLFWALKGGGGGSFGVVTRLTLRTHDLPKTFGAVFGAFRATSDEAFRKLLLRFLETYDARLFNPHWGEQVQASPQNRLNISMTFQGLDAESALEAWGDFKAFVTANPDDYEIERPLQVLAIPPSASGTKSTSAPTPPAS